MAYCSKCGAQVDDNAAFCAKCGQPVTGVAPANAPPVTPPASGGTGLSENVAGLLCYALGWVSGLIFFLIDKRPYVRFHAAQSMIVFGGLQVITIIFGRSFYPGFGYGGFVFGGLAGLVDIVAFILWILLMIKAYQGERFRVPIAAGVAENLARK